MITEIDFPKVPEFPTEKRKKLGTFKRTLERWKNRKPGKMTLTPRSTGNIIRLVNGGEKIGPPPPPTAVGAPNPENISNWPAVEVKTINFSKD